MDFGNLSYQKFQNPENFEFDDYNKNSEKQDMEFNRPEAMSPFIGISVCCLLEEAMDQLLILQGLFTKHGMFPQVNEVEYKTIEERFKHMNTTTPADTRLNWNFSDYFKLQRDNNELMIILKTAFKEISYCGTYDKMIFAMEVVKNLKSEEDELMEDVKKHKTELATLKAQYKIQKNNLQADLKNASNTIQRKKFEIEDALNYSKCELNYLKKYEHSRREQHEMTCKVKEAQQDRIVKDTMYNIEMEEEAHMEITKFIQEYQNDQMELIEYWMKKYDDDLDRLETNIAQIKSKHEVLTAEHEFLLEMYEKDKEEVDAYLEQKRQHQIEQLFERTRNRAATKIQSWWRNIMIVKKLGPYKPKKGKKGKK